MRRSEGSLFGTLIDPFMDYLSPQTEDYYSSNQSGSGVSLSAFNSEKLCLLIFVLALIFVAVISPILCFGSLFLRVQLEELWYFWVITVADLVFLASLLRRRIGKR